MATLGYKHYMFIDGDLPGNGDDMSLPGHEAMMITNKNTLSFWNFFSANHFTWK